MRKVGQDISITTNAYPNETFKAKVSFIDPVLNQETRTVTMRAVLNNSKGKFKPAMFVTGKVEATEKQTEQQLNIPATAVLWTGKRSVVYVKPEASKPVFEMREVVLGGRAGDNYQVEKGLKAGEEIVTNGVFTIDASAQLQGKKSMMNHAKEITESFSTPNEFKEQLQKAYEAYIGLKDALVKTDANAAKTSAENLQKELTLVDMKLLTKEEAHKQWMQLIPALKSSNAEIVKATDVAIQRKHFKVLSEHFIMAVQSFGINEVTYKQYCPMADSDKGAYWLSKEKQVLNPYFGDMMLKCGEVKETINNN